MCGIAGCISNKNVNLEPVMAGLAKRGPDAKGSFAEGSLKLCHTRLTIVDSSDSANQPMVSRCGRYVLVFNGEIYNYKTLRNEMLKRGRKLVTSSDTEVLLNLLIEHGEDAISQLDGMFAFGFFDRLERKLLCARDHLGVKPLYYYWSESNRDFYFCSELDSLFQFPIEKNINEESIYEFLSLGWLYEPDTGFKDVYKLEPGMALTITEKKPAPILNRYFDLAKDSFEISEDHSELIRRAIKLQRYNEVPIGNFFSGGVDSSVIAAICSESIENIENVSIVYNRPCKFKKGGDEYYAKKIGDKLNLKIRQMIFSEDSDAIRNIEFMAEKSPDLNCDFTLLPTYNLSKFSRGAGFKIMLSGMGADEVFGGYPRYLPLRYFKFFKLLTKLASFVPVQWVPRKFRPFLNRLYGFFSSRDFTSGYGSLIGYFNESELDELLIRDRGRSKYLSKVSGILARTSGLSLFKQGIYLDIYGFLAHNLSIADRASMLASLELRVPFINQASAIKAFSSPDRELINLFFMKVPLIKLLARFIPYNLIIRKKVGFNPSLGNLVNSLTREQVQCELSNSPMFDFVKQPVVERLVIEHFDKQADHSYKIYQLLFLNFWLKVNRC